MAAPKLKTTAPTAGPRLLRPSGAVPTAKPKLKGADGKTIQPKAPAPKPAETPAPVAAPTPAVDTAAEEAAAAAKAAEEAAAAAAAKAAEEAAAAAAAKAAEEAAAKAAQEEYERQMEEYNRQMEEYNRQMAAMKAEEEARAAADAAAAAAAAAALDAQPAAEEPAPAPAAAAPKPAAAKPALKPAGAKLAPKPAGAKLGVAKAAPKPAGLAPKKAAPKPAAAPAPAPAPAPVPAPDAEAAPVEGEAAPEAAPEEAAAQPSEAELAARDAMLTAMQLEASRPPIWKRPGFLMGTGALLAIFGICGTLIVQDRAEKAAAKAYQDKVNAILIRASNINKQGIESLADAKAKNVEIVCSKEDAQCLLSIVVNPFVKKENGRNLLGGNPEGVAQQACLLLGIASEKDAEIDKLIFDTLAAECNNPTFKPSLFRWLVQRMVVSNNKGINKKLKNLAKTAATKTMQKGSETVKWKKKGEVLAAIWEAIGLRVTPKDIPEIVVLLKDDACENQLATSLSICLDNIVTLLDDPAEKAKVGDQIFDALPDKLRSNMAGTLAHACSPKALAHYKKRMEDTKNWKGDSFFFANYYNDDIIPYLQELKGKAGGDAKKEQIIDRCIASVVGQNRPRTLDEANKLLPLVFDKLNEDTSAWDDIINKTDPDGADFVGEDSPEYAKLMERRKAIEQCRKQKLTLISTLSGMHNHEWVVALLDKFMKDPDSDIASDARRARERVDKNTADDKAMRSSYKKRDKE